MLDLSKPFPERFWRIADRVRQRSGYLFKPFRFEQQDKFIADLKEVYDDAWRFHENFTPINAKDVKHSLDEARPFFDEDLVWFVYHQDEPIAFFIMYPDFNEILKHFNGKIKGLGVLKYLWLKSRKSTFTRTRVTIMGVKPRYQRMGIESGIFWHLRKVMDKKPHYKELELRG